METTSVKLFKNGQSQAVRIPKAMEFQGVDEVAIVRDGDSLVLRPARKSWASFAAEAAAIGGADDDFMRERPSLFESNRVNLDEG